MHAPRVSEPAEPPVQEKTGASTLQLGQPFNPSRMFSGIFVPDVLVRYRGLNPTAKFLWARLARYVGEDGRVYPSVPTLAAELGLSDRQVQRGLAALEREGFIRRTLRKTAKGDFTSTAYEFLFHRILLEGVMITNAQPKGEATRRRGVVTDVSPP